MYSTNTSQGPVTCRSQKDRGLAGQISRVVLSGPIQREHSGRRPFGGQSARPGHLQPRIVPAAGHRIGAGRQTEEQCRGNIEPTWRGAKLFLYSDGQVAESRGAAATGVQVVV